MLLECATKYKKTVNCLLAFCFVTISQMASAHVKWFAPYDIVSEPRGFLDVLTPVFFGVLVVSIVGVFLIAWVDQSKLGLAFNEHIAGYRQGLQAKLPENFSSRAIRYTSLVFFVCIWSIGGIILTPELTYENSFLIGFLHVAIILCLFTPKTSKYAGIGILLLWLYSAYHYGFFHVSDYVIFLGLGLFIIYASYSRTDLTRRGFLILYIAISVTLQWASIEKFVYPEWTFPILEERPYLSFGLSGQHFMILAGVVEFACAFLLISVSGIAFVVTTLALNLVFVLAIFDFGKVDAIGHMVIIGCLLVMTFNGPAKINLRFASMHSNAMYNAVFVALIYCASLMLFFILYYGVRDLWLLSI